MADYSDWKERDRNSEAIKTLFDDDELKDRVSSFLSVPISDGLIHHMEIKNDNQ